MRFLWLAAFLVAALASAQAADILNFPKPPTSAVRPADISASCLEWSDGCRICAANDKGSVCSNVGIACLPQKWRCTRP